MNKKKQTTGIPNTRSVQGDQALLRDTGKALKLKTGLKAGGIKGEAN